ncbi:MAG TPA: Stk1 family PASTA domain-containing Ser/Thr kinase [Halanaerobiales bacterium]|nr:Stk1 family PASTA domain-containing Ser/Thr kinase [Halanaerobiales bacterium]HPZ62418.1 Stk1 family PASTA domain-containing Ser/Thr kinase [Halanaerobiales bacterium]HQD03816.1 Stk1 family PASTA domain-containing Ser/Thr kinase [Halanaerobiales bacterium]
MIGKILNERYKIIKELGKGGMAIVYEAQDLLLDRKVALKMLRAEYVNDANFIKRFRHEAKAVAKLSHPNVVNIYDIGQEGNYQYLVMEDVEGTNLKDLIEKKGRLELVETLGLAKQILAALAVAHKNNIIHCDIKPHNILLTRDMQVKVTDFGIARAISSATTMTITDTIVGSAHYFSPEQARGADIETRSDLYSLGIVIYEMLTGVVPFRGDSPISVALKHIQELPKLPSLINPEIPKNVEQLIMKAIAKDPEDRFATAEEMKAAIDEILADLRFRDKSRKTDFLDDGATRVIKKADLKESSKRDYLSEREYVSYREETRIPAWLKWTIFLFLFFIIALTGSFIFYRQYMDVPVVEVPDLLGKDLADARKDAAQVGLHLELQNEGIHHPEIPENHIISQYPLGGERVRQTRKIMVTISLGPAVLTVPDLTNLSLREARILLENQKLTVGDIEEIYSDEFARGTVISQYPAAGEEILLETEIDLLVSKGPEPNMVPVPNLIGLSLEEAIEKLEGLNFKIGNISEKMTRRFLSNQVAEMAYEAGTAIPEGSEVDLVVSSGLINTQNDVIHKGVTMNFTVPAGIWNQYIEIVIIDNNGRDLIYEGEHHPGDFIQVIFNSVGSTYYEIYINQQLRFDGTLSK